VARYLEPEQARLYELIWIRTIASQMESAELERTTVDIAAQVGPRKLDLRATGQVVKFDGFLTLYREGRDDPEPAANGQAGDDEDDRRLPPMSAGDPLERRRIAATQHFTEPPPRYTEASLVKRMEELGIGRPSTYAAVLAVLREREYVRIDKKRLVPEDKGLLVTAFLESFFRRYVEYDFTADLEEKLDEIANHEIDWKQVLRDFWQDFSAAIGGTKELRTTEVLDALNEILGPHIFPSRADGADPRTCPNCNAGQLSLKLGRYGAFVGCSNYPECRYTRQFIVSGEEGVNGDGATPGVRLVGEDPQTGLPVTVRDGRFGPFIQLGEAENGEKPKRASIPKGTAPGAVDLEHALKLLSLPREVARHPESGDPIVANIGRYGPYVQHGKTYANLGKDDDVLEIGGNRAIDLIVAKESGVGQGPRRSDPGRALGEDPATGKQVVAKSGRYGPYVSDGTVNATLPRDMSLEAVTLDEGIALLNARRASGGGKSSRRAAGRSAGRATKAAAKKPASAKKAAKKKSSAKSRKGD
jgi:DNA topoisomerase-1